MIALFIHAGGAGGLLATVAVAAVLIWVIFYVLPLPSVIRTVFAVLIALALVLMLLPGCSTSTGSPTTNARNAGLNAAGKAALADAEEVLGKGGTQTLFTVASQELTGAKVDYGQAAAAALWAQVNSQTTGQIIGDAVSAYSAGKAAQTAKAAATAATGALSSSGGQQDGVAVAHAIAEVISTAAGAPPAK